MEKIFSFFIIPEIYKIDEMPDNENFVLMFIRIKS